MRKVQMRSILLIFLISSMAFAAQAQSRLQVDFYKTRAVFPAEETKRVYEEAQSNKNELEMTFSGLFLFYKSFISSQDAVSCVFIPSCSEHALQSVKQKGLIFGGLNAMDRLTRCHPLAIGGYEFDMKTGLLIDPVQ